MPANDNLIQIAKVLKSNGIQGEVMMSFPETDPVEMKEIGPVFICFDGLPVPFFMESVTPKGSVKALVKLQGIDTLEDAEEIVGQPVYAPSDWFEDEGEDGPEALIGWTLCGEDGREYGTVEDFEDIPGNPCLYIRTAGGQVMLPLHEDLILSLDEDRRRLSMRIPEGLL